MKQRFTPPHALIAFCAAGLLAIAAPSASATPVQLAPRIQLSAAQLERLHAVADQGADALRRYLWRTRMIYNWTYQDLVGTM